MEQIKLKTLDDVSFIVSLDTIKCSETIQKLLVDCEMENGQANISLPNVDSTVLAKILVWVEHHKDDVPPSQAERKKKKEDEEEKEEVVLSRWEVEFFKGDLDTVLEITKAAEYLNIVDLFLASCKHVAEMIKGKNFVDMRKFLKIPQWIE